MKSHLIQCLKTLLQLLISYVFRFVQSRHRFGGLKLILTIGIIAGGTTACQKRPENMLIISIDALNCSALKIYNDQAPELKALDQFANRSVVFERAYTSASWTLPAHGSLFTGLYPDRHGAVHEHLKLTESIANLADQLKHCEFDTAAFTDGGFVSRDFGFNKGFDRYDHWIDPSATWQGPEIPRNGYRNFTAGRNLFDRGIAFINGRKNRKNGFFLFLHTYVVHDYYMLHSWAVNHLPPYPDKGMDYYQACVKGNISCPQQDWDRLRALYRAELHRMDMGFNRLLKALDEQGLSKSTLIVFISDHGEGFDPDRGRIHHGGRLHQDQIHIPLIVSGPGIHPRVIKTPVSIVDIMPTILDLFNIAIPQGLDGRSFAHLLRGEKDTSPHTIYAMEHFYSWHAGRRVNLNYPQKRPLSVAVIHGEDWYIQDRKGEEIYHMIKDPLQTCNLAPKSPMISKLKRLAEKRNVYRPSAPAATPEKKVMDQLRSLGYID